MSVELDRICINGIGRVTAEDAMLWYQTIILLYQLYTLGKRLLYLAMGYILAIIHILSACEV